MRARKHPHARPSGWGSGSRGPAGALLPVAPGALHEKRCCRATWAWAGCWRPRRPPPSSEAKPSRFLLFRRLAGFPAQATHATHQQPCVAPALLQLGAACLRAEHESRSGARGDGDVTHRVLRGKAAFLCAPQQSGDSCVPRTVREQRRLIHLALICARKVPSLQCGDKKMAFSILGITGTGGSVDRWMGGLPRTVDMRWDAPS